MNIHNNQIHIWMTNEEKIKDPELLSNYYELLDNEERERYSRFHFERDRHQYLITRSLVRNTLSLYSSETSPSDWRFEKNKYGKPYIKNDNLDIEFNVTHTNGMIVLALASRCNIGVDAEYTKRKIQHSLMAKNLFSPAEEIDFSKLINSKKDNHFFSLWTLKEAYTKAYGMGLSIPFNHLTFKLDANKIDITFNKEWNDNPSFWKFWQFDIGQDHKLAIAARSKTENIMAIKPIFRTTIPMVYSSPPSNYP